MYPNELLFGLNLYEILMIVAVVVCFLLCDRMTQIKNFSITLQKLTIVAVFASVVLGYGFAVLFQAVYNYFDTDIFKIASDTGATFYGGLLGGAGVFLSVWFLGGKLFLKGEKQGEEVKKFPDMLHIAACCIPLGHGIGRLGCFFAGCCHGKESDAWYAVRMHTEKGYQSVVPVQLFEAIFLFLLAGVLFYLFFKKQNLPLFPVYCGGYGVWRFFIEYARNDDRGASCVSFLSPSQCTALLLVLFSLLYFIIWISRKRRKDNE